MFWLCSPLQNCICVQKKKNTRCVDGDCAVPRVSEVTHNNVVLLLLCENEKRNVCAVCGTEKHSCAHVLMPEQFGDCTIQQCQSFPFLASPVNSVISVFHSTTHDNECA